MLEYVDRANKVTDDTLLKDLINVSQSIGVTKITIEIYETHGKYDPSTFMRHFGTWTRALQLAGLKISNREYTLQELYDNLAKVWLTLGHQPSKRDLALAGSLISYKAYERKFGKWSLALKSFIEYYNSEEKSSQLQTAMTNSETVHTTTRDVSLRTRFLVMQKDNFRCRLCGASPATDPSVKLHVDHIIPWANGGETIITNLQTLCSMCNLGKSNLPLNKTSE